MVQLVQDEFGQRFTVGEDGVYRPTPATTVEEAQQIEFIATLKSYGRSIESMLGGDRDALRLEEKAENELLAGLRQDRPVATAVGGALPITLATGGVGGGIGTSALLGMFEGLLDFDEGSQGQFGRASEGTASAVLGDVAGRMAGRVVNGVVSIGRNFRTARAAQRLEDAGGAVTAGQRIDDNTLRGLETSLASSPLTSKPFTEIAEKNTRVANQAAADAIGYTGDVSEGLSAEVMDIAAKDLEQVFETSFDGDYALDLGEEFGEQMLGLEQFKKLRNLGGLPDLDAGKMTGAEIGTVRNAISEEMSKAYDKGDGQLGKRLREMLDDFDQASGEIIGPENVEALKVARERWRVLKELEAGNSITGGNVNPVTLNNRLTRNFGTSVTRGRTNQLTNNETGTLLETMGAMADPKVRPIVGSSGTAERQAVREAVSNPAAAAVQMALNPVINKLESTPMAAGVVAALLQEQAPQIFKTAGRQAGVAGATDPLTAMIYGQVFGSD